MRGHPPNRKYDDPPDLATRLTLGLVAVCLTAGLGWLVQSAGDSHVHVTSKGVERHQHGHLGEHTHGPSDAAGHSHDTAVEDVDGSPESDESEEQSSFFTAAWFVQAAPDLPTGLPALGAISETVSPPSFTPPTQDVKSRAQPRAPPAVPASVRSIRAV